jgi:hypothetical protein
MTETVVIAMAISADKILEATSGYAAAKLATGLRPVKMATIDPGFGRDDFLRGRLPRVLFDGELEPGDRRYPVLVPYWPRAGERVIMLPVADSSYVIIGAVVDNEIDQGAHVAELSAGNIATGSHTFNAPGDFFSVSAGRAAETTVDYGSLTGEGETRVFATNFSATGIVLSCHTHSITGTSAVIRVVDTASPSSGTNRTVQWMAVRGFDYGDT